MPFDKYASKNRLDATAKAQSDPLHLAESLSPVSLPQRRGILASALPERQ